MVAERLYGAVHFRYDPVSEAAIFTTVGADGTEPTSTRNPMPIGFGNTAQTDAFGRLRVSNPFGIFDSKQIASNDPYSYEEKLVGTATSTFQYDRSSTYLAIGTATGDRAVRQTSRYFPYVPGKSHQITCTGVFAAGKTNLSQYIGYGDDLNGLFFKLQGTTLGVVIRSSVSGSPVDTFVAQADWNIDKLDGTGASGVTIDIAKAQIFSIDFQWLGVGRIRFGVDIDGILIVVHEVLNANIISSVYIATPTLPVRYEIVNTGVTADASTLEQICCSVSSEGGYSVPGLEFSASTGITRNAVTTREPILLIRLKSAFPVGEPNRRIVRVTDYGATTTGNNAYIELVHLHNPTVTATWADIDDSSGVEYATTITSVTATHSHVVKVATAMTGVGVAGGVVTETTEYINAHSYISQNFDSTNSEIMALYATSESGTANVAGHITFIESE